MRFSTVSKFASMLVAVALMSLGGGLSASATTPTIPGGQALWAFTWSPSYPVLLNLSSNEAVITPENAPLSSIPYSEGGGFDSVTGKTWLLTDSCELWTLDSAGVTTLTWDLQVTTTISNLSSCDAFMSNNDGTAYVTGWQGRADGYLFHIRLSDGSVIGTAVHAGDGSDDAWITGLSKNPDTGEYWVSTTTEAPIVAGLYPIDIATGAINRSRIITLLPGAEAWDIAFDSSGLLWMSSFSPQFSIQTIDISDSDPISTLYDFGALHFSAGATPAISDALWFVTEPVPTTEPAASTPELASTGNNLVTAVAVSGLSISAGLTFFIFYALRAKKRR